MGVSGTGKSTIGKALSLALDIPFFDGDDFHPVANIEKMTEGLPLNDEDRKPWLEKLGLLAASELEKKGAIIACSALKASYRTLLSKNISNHTKWVFLHGSSEVIRERMKNRSDHFMPPALLKSQFDALEIPENAIKISILDAPNDIVKKIIETVKN